ncbi:MAG TPA: hypothetical protein HA349_10535 [Methanotrichaceae archaeon]|nr:hypothetical protein [Methanotrichaceae archaeon]
MVRVNPKGAWQIVHSTTPKIELAFLVLAATIHLFVTDILRVDVAAMIELLYL